MACIVIGVKSQKIAVKNTKQELVSDGQYSVDFAAWEWRVQEEANLNI